MDPSAIESLIERHLPWLAPLFFVLVWVAVTKTIARLSGWSELAEKYPARRPFSGLTVRFQSARFRRGMNLNNCLTVGGDHTGLHLSMFRLFSMGHAPLFIPWSDIAARREKGRFWNAVRLTFLRSPGNWISISETLGNVLARESAGQLHIEDAPGEGGAGGKKEREGVR